MFVPFRAGKRDVELIGLAQYLAKDFMKVTFRYWTDVLSGRTTLQKTREEEKGYGGGRCRQLRTARSCWD